MSFVTRRALSTLIPPKVASPKAIGAAPDAIRMQRVVSFYEKLPRGAAPEVKAKGLLGRYQAKYFGKNPQWQAHHSRHCLPRCHWLCPELLLPPAPPQEQRPLNYCGIQIP
ncbi:ATP synthase f chain, mitochondrial precursor [Fusarium falciforme]|nr:ATP synthase f chain, mitochondrial precursor [Fusarium falciforme]